MGDRFSENDLKNLGLSLQPDGTYAKPKIIQGMAQSRKTMDLSKSQDKIRKPKPTHVDLINEVHKIKTIEEGNIRINVKPLSVNKCYTGQRWKTDAYMEYKLKITSVLPNIELPHAPYKIYYRFGFSNPRSDFDNAIKTTTDVLATFYKFNDKLIRKAIIETDIVPKGMEYVEFKIESL